MEPPAEIKEAMLAAYAKADAGHVLQHFSHQAGVLVIGTDPNEWWTRYDTIAAIHEVQRQAMGDQAQIKPGEIQAFVEGTVGWAADRAVLCVLGQEVPVRVTTVFHREDGRWRIVQRHISVGVLSSDVLGKDLTTQQGV